MRRRLLITIVGATVVGVAVFGVTLAVAVSRLYRNEAALHLERQATRFARLVDAESRLTNVEIPASSGDESMTVYDSRGTRLGAGKGPPVVDAPTRFALHGQVGGGVVGHEIVVAVPIFERGTVDAVVRAAIPEASVRSRTLRTYLVMAALAVLAVTIAVLVALLQIRRIAGPINSLTRAVDRLGHGEFTVRAPRTGIAELDEAGAALDATATRLGDLIERERSFTADASHQLRTPLTGLRLELEGVLAAGVGDPAEATEALEGALSNVDRITATLEHLLALARDVPEDRARMSIGAALDDLARSWRNRLERSGRAIKVEVESDLPDIEVSTSAFAQILEVLVDNATTHGAGCVSLNARSVAGNVFVEVSDAGDGVANPDAIFRRRAGAATGHGIGLALARSLAGVEGGRLLLQRAGPNPVFALVLPAQGSSAMEPRSAGPP